MDHTHFAMRQDCMIPIIIRRPMIWRSCCGTVCKTRHFMRFSPHLPISLPHRIFIQKVWCYAAPCEKNSDISTGDVEILGGKTGFTSFAGLCLASLGEVNGERYIVVNAGAPGDHQHRTLSHSGRDHTVSESFLILTACPQCFQSRWLRLRQR